MNVDVIDLGDLEPDDPRPASQQIANVLRAAILTRRFAPGQRLPSQNELADRYGVARETIKSALRILRDERLVVSRQGSGAFVRSAAEKPACRDTASVCERTIGRGNRATLMGSTSTQPCDGRSTATSPGRTPHID